jgi:hypothetical protein
MAFASRGGLPLPGRWLAQASISGAIACAAGLGQVLCQRVEARAEFDAQTQRLRRGQSRCPHAGVPRPDEAFLPHLVLEQIEIPKADLARLDLDRAGGNRRLIQLQAAPRPHDDAVEALVFRRRCAA